MERKKNPNKTKQKKTHQELFNSIKELVSNDPMRI